ncbi:MAG: hypothetical protein PHS02_03460, partial [Candidatus ainarchaeum sp.]|nr:hypothetical protein [Candidatus ainarchaeum sp.]
MQNSRTDTTALLAWIVVVLFGLGLDSITEQGFFTIWNIFVTHNNPFGPALNLLAQLLTVGGVVAFFSEIIGLTKRLL